MANKHIYVISDLHLGGAPDVNGISFQMCPPESRRRLARFIRHISAAHPSEPTQLVINGDFVDFLAEKRISTYPEASTPESYQTDAFTSSQDAAVAKLHRAIEQTDDGSKDDEKVFAALRAFLSQGHQLTLLLGNHDLELSLPAVRHALLSSLSAGPAQIEFLYDGEALVFDGVLIEHGNRYDGWNAVSHGTLRAFRSATSRGEQHISFVPPAGSQLVATIMNPLKHRYRFIDLLKPENEALIPILTALEPDTLISIKDIAGLLPQKFHTQTNAGRVPKNESLVASKPNISDQNNRDSIEQAALQELEENAADDSVQQRTQALLDQASKQWAPPAGRVSKEDAQVASTSKGWLTSVRSLWHLLKNLSPNFESRLLNLRQALLLHKNAIATTFDFITEDPIYSKAAERLSDGGRIVVFGHTHLPKCVKLDRGGYYLNSGTWCPTIRLPIEFYDHTQPDKTVLPKLKEFVISLAENKTDQWCTLQTTFVKITLAGNGARAALCEFHDSNHTTELASTHGLS